MRTPALCLRAEVFLPLSLAFAFTSTLLAQTFVGTNQPGQATDFTFTLGAGTTNLSLVVSNDASEWSYLLLKRGGLPSDTDYDFASRLDRTNNQINLQLPEFKATNYGLRVVTPAESAEDAFAVALTTNRTNLRSAAYPALKPLAFSTPGAFPSGSAEGSWQYFQVDMPTNLPAGWRLVLSSPSANNPDLYVRRGALPDESYHGKASTGQGIDTIVFTETEATAGTYFIGVRLPSAATTSVSYTLSAEIGYMTELTWDPGTTHLGTEVFTNTSPTGGDYYFHLTTLDTVNGLWRTALNVQSGEADAYLTHAGFPSMNDADYVSTRVGSDGFVLSQFAGQFAADHDWYLLIHATPGAQWNLVSGEAYVQPLPDLAPDASSGATATMGAEGMHFFKTTISPSTLGWRLSLNGLNNELLVKQTTAPHPQPWGSYDWAQPGQMLLVPPYLNIGDSYFIGVVGDPGLNFTLDSRQQAVTDLAFGASTSFSVSAGSFPYRTFRVQVPVDQIAWQVNVTPTSGNADLAVRRGALANEFYSDAFSDVASTSDADSVTMVPPGLSDGTFYITVYGTAPYSGTLTNGGPVITDVDYLFRITNDAPSRVGWRFYRVANTDQQAGTLGWDLFLQNQPPGTEIALRRSAVPARWNSRDNGYVGGQGYVDYSGPDGFLQRPGHQADIWYLGIYSPTSALGNFVFTGQQLGGASLSTVGGNTSVSVTNQPLGRWQYFRVDVPAGALGWDMRLVNVTSGRPQLVMRRDQLPSDLYSSGWYWWQGTTWPSGYQLAAGGDLTGRAYDPSGQTNEDGRVLQLTMGNPLEPGTYYVGVLNGYGNDDPMSYTLQLRSIGPGQTILVRDLAFTGGVISSNGLPPREAAYFRMAVPDNAPSWKVKLSTNAGEVLLFARKELLPGVGGTGARMQKDGDEHYLLLPDYGQTNLTAGTYYLTVVGEGNDPINGGCVGTNTCNFTLTSFGALAFTNLGVLDASGATDLVRTNGQEGGEIKAFQFMVPPGTLAFEVSLENRVGNPVMALRVGAQIGFADPLFSGYGREGGQSAAYSASDLMTVVNPTNGVYTLVVQASHVNGTYTNASYRIRVHARLTPSLAFEGGSASFTNQNADTWQYFRVTVPSNAFGWDLRLVDVTSGSPAMAVCRDLLPTSLGGTWGWGAAVNTSWPSGYQWTPNTDWTGCTFDPTGTRYEHRRILTAGMGNPLEPGTYYVGVRGDDNPYDLNPISYTLVSRGIGTNYAIGIQNLAFAGGAVSSNGLAARDWACYRVDVPANTPSWRLKLTNSVGDTTFVIRRGGLPASDASGNLDFGGVSVHKTGDETLLLMSTSADSNLVAGPYYVAVASQGEDSQDGGRIGTNASSFTLLSLGPLGIIGLGTVDPSGTTDLVHSNGQAGAECKAFQFTVPSGTLSLEVRLEDRTGAPMMALRADGQLASPSDYWTGSYGVLGGRAYQWADDSLITIANPPTGVYTLMIKATATAGPTYPDASYTIRLHASGTESLAFDGGAISVTDQASGDWRFFLVQVPADALGWDLRLTNITLGTPRFVVQRDTLPDYLDTTYPWNPGVSATWPSGYKWMPGYQMATRMVASMGNPLEPGTYYIGVKDASPNATPCSYTLVSRGIGTGLSIPVGEISFAGGTVSTPALPASEAAYYRVVVPSNTPSWKIRLAADVGDSYFVLRKDGLPNSAPSGNFLWGGFPVKQPGNDHLLWLPEAGQTSIPAGTFYFAVWSEGMNPSDYGPGTNASAFTLTSVGVFNPTNLGPLGASDLTRANTLECGEIKAYQFTIPAGSRAVEVRLDNRVGNPILTMDYGNEVPRTYNQYGIAGGGGYNWYEERLITLPNARPTNYTIAVQAQLQSGVGYVGASYTLVVHPLPVPELNFAANLNTNGLSNVATGSLADNQRAFYKVVVPAANNGAPVLGWKLLLAPTFGAPQMRVAKDKLPQDDVGGSTVFVPDEAIIVPDYLTPGTWYVEVKGVGGSAYTLTSTELTLKRLAWTMPVVGQPVTTPGLPPSGPLFGDTGVGTNGVALPGDQGTDLGEGDLDYYAVIVPSNNVGLIRTRLDAISGNPNLYLRVGLAPTVTYNSGVWPYWVYDRFLNGTAGSEYGNWVSMNGRYEAFLPPGIWYLAVHAAGGSNVRYRLRVSTGDIQDLALNGGSFANQTLTAGDWRYYRVQMPSNAPLNWNVTFSQDIGDVMMHVRDTTPPGFGQTPGYGSYDWEQDAKNHGPYLDFDSPGTHTFSTPPLRPGAIYYLGFRAVSDATFSVSSTTSGGTIDVTNALAFYGGTWTNELPAYGAVKFRIDVPADATRWRHAPIAAASVYQYLSQGTLPTPSAAHWAYGNAAPNTGLNQSLVTPNNWPWLPGYSYYLLVTNTSATPQPFAIRMDGRNAATEDEDNDGLPDIWENLYFGNTWQYDGTHDPDSDLVTNAAEFAENTIPTNNVSFRPRLTTVVNGLGNLVRSLYLSNYVYGSTITLTATPGSNTLFTGWSGDASGTNNPLSLLLDGHKRVQANFETTNCQPVPAGLLAWWKAEGNARDAWGNYDGFLRNGATCALGIGGQAFSLGGNKYVEVPDSPTWAFGTNEFTIELWANFNSGGNSQAFVASDTGPGYADKWIFWLNGGVLRFHINGSSDNVNIGDAPFSPEAGRWYHVALTRSGETYTFFIDGTPVSTNTTTAVVPDANAPLTIGQAEGQFFFNGLLDEVSIYSRALSAQEVQDIFMVRNAGKCAPFDGLALFGPQHLDDGMFRFTILGHPNRTNTIQASTTLTNWTTLTNLLNSNGALQFTNQQAPDFNWRFYRVISP
ncbi:MAG: LamG domain-containing protein [Verrucomicrobia bacterium]|nr:LamG domain-containing protein [Verrucomicrobiota bacterium]